MARYSLISASLGSLGHNSAAIYGKDPFGNVIERYEIRDVRIAQLAR